MWTSVSATVIWISGKMNHGDRETQSQMHSIFNRIVFAVLILLFGVTTCFAKFTVQLTDGSSQDVSKIYFNGEKADLFLVSGVKRTVPVSSIDFDKSGFKRPNAAITTIYGTGQPAVSSGLSQPELEDLWNRSTTTAVANNDFGSVVKGETVHVVESTPVSTIIITRDPSGKYKRIVLDTATFMDTFGQTPSQQAPASKVPAPTAPPVEDTGELSFEGTPGNAQQDEIPDEKDSPRSDLLWIGGGGVAAVLVLLILTIAVKGAARWVFLLALIGVCVVGGNSAMKTRKQLEHVQAARDRVAQFFTNYKRLSYDNNVHAAVAYWSRGTSNIKNATEYAAAKSECFRWLETGKIGIVHTFGVKGEKLEQDSSVTVFVSIDDQLKKILVTDGQPLSWAENNQQ